MRIEIEYGTQIRTDTGIERQSIDVHEPSSLADLLALLASTNNTLDRWLHRDGTARAGLLVFVNDQSPQPHGSHQLSNGDLVSLLTLVSGG